MKRLNLFTHFDFQAFSKDKKFLVINKKSWVDFRTGEILGTKFEIVISEDNTNYGVVNEDNSVNNLFEKFTVKIAKGNKVDIPMNAEVRLINPRANVYGDYRNQLSVTADGLQVVK